MDRSYFLLSQKIQCTHKKCKKKFTSNNPTFVASLPPHVRLLYPAFLTRKLALDLLIVRMMVAHINGGFGTNQIAKMIREMHMLRYHERFVTFLSLIKTRRLRGEQALFGAQTLKPEDTCFTKFFDKDGYNGYLPTGQYFTTVYNRYTESVRDALDNEVIKRTGTIIKADHSHKVTKRLSKFNGCAIFDGVFTLLNENEEIVGQFFTISKSLQEVKGALEKIRDRFRRNGLDVTVLFTDNCCQDRAFYEDVFGSLKQAVVPAILAKCPLAILPPDLKTIYRHQLTDINAMINLLNEDVESEKTNVVGLDAEWDTPIPAGETARVALIQIATAKSVYLFQVRVYRYI
jgi:hypothetical protein